MVGLGTVGFLAFAVLLGLLSVLFDVPPAEVSLPVMQLSRTAESLDGPVMRLGCPLFYPLHVSIGPRLELSCAAHLLGRRTGHRLHAVAIRIVVLTRLPRWCLSFFNLLGSLAGTITGLARTLEAPFASLVLVASARWNSHVGQHRSTSGCSPPSKTNPRASVSGPPRRRAAGVAVTYCRREDRTSALWPPDW